MAVGAEEAGPAEVEIAGVSLFSVGFAWCLGKIESQRGGDGKCC